MRFERIVIRNFRAIREYRIELPPSGVVVIEGDNELGKSSIAEALWLVFEYPDSSESERVRAVKPVDRDAGAEIEVTVSTGDYRFHLRKQYHRNTQTLLRIESPRRQDLTGREAHDRVQQILNETTDRGLWEALRLMQGDALEEVTIGGNLSIARALDEAAISSLGGEREQSLFERVENEYLRYFTRTGKENKEYTNCRAAVQRHQDDAARFEDRLRQLETLAERCVELDRRLAALAREQDDATAGLTEVEARGKERDDAAQAVKELERELVLARTRLEQMKAQSDRRHEAAAEIATIEGRIAGAEKDLTEARARLEVFQHTFAEAEATLSEAKAKFETVSAAVEVARADYGYMHEQLQVRQMSERLARVRKAQHKLRQTVEFLNGCRLNPRVLAELEEAERTIEVDRARLEAEGARVEISGPAGTALALDGQERALDGEALRHSVSGTTNISLPGGIQVRVSAGRSVAAIQERLAQAITTFEARCRDLAVSGVEEARALETRRLEAVNERRHLETQIRADLDDLQSAEELEAKIERDRQRGERHLATRTARAPMPADLQEARRRAETASDAEKEARAGLAPLEAAVRGAQNGATTAAERVNALERQLTSDRELLASRREWLDARRHEQSDEALNAALAEAEEAAGELEAQLAQANARLEALPDVTAERATALGRVESLRREARHCEDELNRHSGALSHAGEAGLQQQRDMALSEQVAAEAELDAFTQRAEAARMLYETLRRHRETAQRSYARPLEDRLNELGKRVFNSTFAIELDKDLKIARRTLDGVTLEFRQLSGGAKEQLGILMRLACASLVSSSGGVPLILDDVLGWSDPGRVARLGRVLADAGAGVQVILLTCTPDRFASVAPATIVSLPSGRVRTVDAAGVTEEPPAPTSTPAPQAPRRQPSRPPENAGARQAGFDLFDVEPVTRR